MQDDLVTAHLLPQVALEMLFPGEPISAQEALLLRLLSRVVPEDRREEGGLTEPAGAVAGQSCLLLAAGPGPQDCLPPHRPDHGEQPGPAGWPGGGQGLPPEEEARLVTLSSLIRGTRGCEPSGQCSGPHRPTPSLQTPNHRRCL